MVIERPRKKGKYIFELLAKQIKISRADIAVIGVQLCLTITEIVVQKHFLI